MKKMMAPLALAALALAWACTSSSPAPAPSPAAPAPTLAPAQATEPAPAPAAAPAAEAPAVDATSAASEEPGWSIALSGLRSDSLEPGLYMKLLSDSRLAVEGKAERKGVAFTYRGIPLRYVLAMVDGADASLPYAFDEALWKRGYDVSLVASDGYTATFSTKDIAPDALVLAAYEDGKPVAPMIVGDSPKNLWVRSLAAIETSLAPSPEAAAADAFALDLDVNGSASSHSLKELEASELWLEEKGSYTTSAGTRYSGVYGGARLRNLIERYAILRPEDSVTFVAMDGYEMTYPGSRILDESDGAWILAWKLDGEYLPKDPGYVRTVKVGPSDPNIDGHLSVRMVKRIVVKQSDFKDFSVRLEGRMGWTLDRATLQSCVSCHKRTVNFERKGQSASYTGFPAYLALGYVDDPKYAPHKQDKSLPAYDSELAKTGYKVDFLASDGFSLALDSKELDRNEDVIIAMYKNDANLGEDEFPLVLVWDKDAKLVPAGIKNVKKLASIKAGL
jgi:hypothetical protein